MRTIAGEIYSLKTICDDASLSSEELALIRAERKGQIKGLETAFEIITTKRKGEKIMNEEMKQALLECCERNCEVLSPDVVAFMKDLINTAIETSENKIDDMFVPIIDMGFEVLNDFLAKQIDKIDGAEG